MTFDRSVLARFNDLEHVESEFLKNLRILVENFSKFEVEQADASEETYEFYRALGYLLDATIRANGG